MGPEEEGLKKIDGEKNESGRWMLPDGRQLLNKPLTRRVLQNIQQKTHWGTQALCDHFLRYYGCIGVYELAKKITEGCIICFKSNRKIMRRMVSGGQELAVRPFQSVQVDFTELPQVQR